MEKAFIGKATALTRITIRNFFLGREKEIYSTFKG